MPRTSRTTEEPRAGCSKRPSSKAAASEEARRTPRYVELLSDARTPLADFFSILLVGWLAIQFTHMSQMNAWAGSPPPPKSTKAAGDAERGRAVFNGKGVCYYCHGIDGNKNQRPQLAADTAALIAQLNPPPVDLRNPKVLYLKTDKQRARAIREGHLGTGMFPDTTMTTQELTDTLAYLAVLRQQDSKRTRKP